MSNMTMKDIAEAMRDIDFAMLNTLTDDGKIAGRPMSNNRDVAFDGDSYFFTYENTRTVEDIKRSADVNLSLQGSKGLLGKPPLFLSVEGRAELIRDRAVLEKHWNSDLEYWFEQGLDTPGIVLIKVHATRIHYWNGNEDGELLV
ncbi:pyridoxamine 5'-phosphate oxidase family protein [Terrihabitans rhizophilus]|uniref:Pyridoxamine 5'-phosphate oxidase family protein n=1 Tax=Terrihabitans rhizophilus TaxID=3092662 RepID=A0ABU4RK61_9HYPH|nr:pyridoxamine 5'-phosphate oxidase family protein [Terrihabitans sp. PJ23]MDX6805197.1 pyridoxamine 5'-phosphate oxidase family protein [Terrihabitans sp. PJ23]